MWKTLITTYLLFTVSSIYCNQMQNKYIIVLTKGLFIEAWGSLKRACDNHPEFDHSSIERERFPFYHKEWKFTKVLTNELILCRSQQKEN